MPFEAAPFGVTGLETAFSALYTHLVEPGVLPLETILERMSAGPARAYGLDRAARSRSARRANLVLLDLNASWRVEEGGFRSRSKNSWLLGETLRGKVRATDRRRTHGVRGMTGFLALEDGTVFRGESVAAEGFAFGEAVFTTAMTGYQEVVTDPSYAEQLVCFTAPMIGNYGVAEERSESKRPHARAVLMREARGPAWTDWLHERGIVALSGLDTRSLVLKLREGGAMRAAVDLRRRVARRGAARDRRAAADGRARARRTTSRRTSRTSTPSTDARGSRSSTTAASARSCAGSPGRAPPSRSSRTTSPPTSSRRSTA